jgi:hypothetical protein
MRQRVVYLLSGMALGALGLGLVHGCSSHRAADSNPVPSTSAPSSTVPNPSGRGASGPSTPVPAKSLPHTSVRAGPVTVKPTAAPAGSGEATLTVTAGTEGQVGGVVVLHVPPSAPEECSPSYITVSVGQSAVAECRSANYGGPIAATVTNPAIALVRTSGGAMLPRYFYVTGLRAGTTTVLVSYQHGPTTRYRIRVMSR